MKNALLSFLLVEISRENKTFLTSVYCKPAFCGVCLNFKSFIPGMYKKRDFIETLLYCRAGNKRQLSDND